MDPEPGTLQDSKEFCVESRERSSGQTQVITVPPQPRTAATVSQQEGQSYRVPKHRGWGCKCLALPPRLPLPVLAEGNQDRRWRWAPGSWSHELI